MVSSPSTQGDINAMSTATEVTATVQDQIVETVKQAQGFALDTLRTWVDAVESLVPELPPLPLAGELPSPEEAVKQGFGFVERLVETQKSFALDVLSAVAPLRKTASTSAS
jgi:hypothetical protein